MIIMRNLFRYMSTPPFFHHFYKEETLVTLTSLAMRPFKWVLLLKGKNLLLEEQILFFQSWTLLIREVIREAKK